MLHSSRTLLLAMATLLLGAGLAPRSSTAQVVVEPPVHQTGGKGSNEEGPQPRLARQAGNEIYQIWVDDGALRDCGAWTAATGPAHPATDLLPIGRKNVLFNGQFANPGTSDTTLRSYDTGLSYRTGQNAGRGGDGNCLQVCFESESLVFEPIETAGPSGPVRTGWRAIWLLHDGGSDRPIEFVQEVNVEGPVDGTESVNNTVIRETHVVHNLGQSNFRFGLRKQWDWQIAADDGPAMGDCATPDEACDRSMNLTADGSRDGFYPTSYTINHDPGIMTCPPGIPPLVPGCAGAPLYLVAGTVAPPSALTPPPDAPELLQFNNWNIVVDSCWWPGLLDAAPCGALGSPTDDTTISYFYGLTSSTAIVLGPGQERSFTQYVVAVEDECPTLLQPPTLSCDAGGPYELECTGDLASVPLDGSGTSDSGETPLYSWTTDCPGGEFDDSSREDPVLTLLTQGCTTTCQVSLTVTDAQDPDASISCSSPVSVEDTQGPELNCPPEPLTIECEAGGVTREHPLVQQWLAQASAFDACAGEAVQVTDDLPDRVRMRACPTRIAVTFEATDDCGNRSTCVQDLILVDTQAPEPNCPPDRSFECGEPTDDKQDWLDSGTAVDGCSGSTTMTSSLQSTEMPCPSTTIETWRFTARDACGNEASCLATWTIGDNSAPVVTAPAPRENECGTPTQGSQDDWFALASADDACSGPLEVQRELLEEDRPCPDTLIQTWRFFAIDDCGHEGEAFSTWTEQDTLPPNIEGVPADETVPCDAVPPPAMPVASDLCDGSPILSLVETREDGDCPGRYSLTRTWTAVDACGNETQDAQTLTVVDDTPPELTGVPADETVSCEEVPPPANPNAIDDCSGATLSLLETREDGACPGDYLLTRRWTATDDCGNSTSESQVLTVVDDQPPQLSGVPADETVDCAAVPDPASPGAEDACSGATVAFAERRVDGPCPQEYQLHRTWTATDDCGNSSSATQILSVEDTTPPTLSGVPADENADCSDVPPPASPTAVDDCGSAVIRFDEARIDGACAGEYQLRRTWTAIDDCDNEGSASQVISVTDTTAPVISGVPVDARVECDAVPAPASPTAEDDCGTAGLEFAEVRVDGSCPQQYELHRTWTATDDCGNSSSETQVVSVVDTTPPVLSGVPADETVDCDAVPAPASPEAEDNCGAALVTFGERRIDGSCPHQYQLVRTWTAEDDCGNSSSETQTVSVVDETPPEIAVPAPLVLECTGPEGVSADDPRVQAWLASASATDNCSSPVSVGHDAPAAFPLGCPDPVSIPVIFTAMDECGNASSAVSTVTIVDTTAPVIESVDLPDCLWVPNHRYVCFEDLASRVVATDNCSGELNVRFAGCASDQPDEAPEDGDRGGQELGNGDGHTVDDCVVAPDGSAACLRSERQGTDEGGRNYTLVIEVSDACGNVATLPWTVHVPHDQSEHDCDKVDNKAMLGKHDPFPWQ